MDNEKDILQLQTNLALEYTREVQLFHANSAGTRLVKDAVRIIQRNLYRAIRVDDIARELSVSRGHLSREFHNEIGVTISNYITQKKIGEAKRLLRSSSATLAQISEFLKFSSQSHFSKVFRLNTGMTPKQFRDTSLKETAPRK